MRCRLLPLMSSQPVTFMFLYSVSRSKSPKCNKCSRFILTEAQKPCPMLFTVPQLSYFWTHMFNTSSSTCSYRFLSFLCSVPDYTQNCPSLASKLSPFVYFVSFTILCCLFLRQRPSSETSTLLTAAKSNKKTKLYGNSRPDHKLLDVRVPFCGVWWEEILQVGIYNIPCWGRRKD